jgi:uncharacterized protein YkwD
MQRKVLGAAILGLVAACGGSTSARPEPAAPGDRVMGAANAPFAGSTSPGAPAAGVNGTASASPSDASGSSPTGNATTGNPGETARGDGLKRKEAAAYVLSLINRDRKAHGLTPVTWDETATIAGQRHANDLAANGVTAHFGTDGSVPEQRYTEASGEDFAMENAGCLADGVKREVDPDPVFSRASLDRIEKAFMDEVPPADGHRRNILTKSHTGVGVGLSGLRGIDIACMVEEFTDDYGSYVPLPRRAPVGATIHVEGKLRAPAKIMGVGLSRVDALGPMTAAALVKTHAYAIPSPYALFFPPGYPSKIPLKVDEAANAFSIDVPLDDRKKPGLYGVSVWATFPGSQDLVMVSLRTVEVSGSR